MRLGFQIIKGVCNVNDFSVPTSYTLQTGNPDTLYFQLVNLDGGCGCDGECPLRYIPPAGSTVTAQFTNIDSNQNLSKIAGMPFPADDRSIWSIPILPSDQIAFNSMTVTLVANGQTYTLLPTSELVSTVADEGRFFC